MIYYQGFQKRWFKIIKQLHVMLSHVIFHFLFQPEFQDIITEDILQQLLNAIPDSMQSKDLTMWLQQDIIPFVNHRFPEGKVSVTWKK